MSSDQQYLKELAAQLRVDSVRSTTAAGSGHPTSSMSAADLMAVLLADHFRYDWNDPKRRNNDRLVFSKGHASPLLYAMYRAAGAIDEAELMTLRKLGSRLEGHPKPERPATDFSPSQGLPWVDVATGSLGQGLPMAVGMALAGKAAFRVWVLLGDSEMAEGSVWEGFDKAAYYGLGKITAILDMNRLGQRGPTEYGWESGVYANRARAFGWNAIVIDGHNLAEIDRAYREAEAVGRPTLIVAKTIKGAGVSSIANSEGWHGKVLSKEQCESAIKELGGVRNLTVQTNAPQPIVEEHQSRPAGGIEFKRYGIGEKQSTRMAFGDALAALGKVWQDLVVLDGEVSNSTYTDAFQKAFPNRFFEIYIAEQQMVSAAIGLSAMGKRPVAATFAAFLTRAFDQIRMAAVSGVKMCLCGSHCGVSIGEDGPSQMGLEDLAMMRAVHGSTVLYPCDPNQTARLTQLMLELPGISYIRTTRGKLPTIYAPDESFAIGGSQTVRSSIGDRITLLAAGVTVHEALKAADTLKTQGVAARVIDLYSVKPIDREALTLAAEETEALIVIEDHWAEGGLGDAVLDAFANMDDGVPPIVKLAVREMPGSGTPEELLHAAAIDSEAILAAARACLMVEHTGNAFML